jgi:DNA-binding beta-propeller fold protein YncE
MRYVYGLGQDYTDIAFNLSDSKFYTAKKNTVRVYDYSDFTLAGLLHLDGTVKYLFNDNYNLYSISTLAGKNIIESIEKSTVEPDVPVEGSGIRLGGRVVDIAYDSAHQKAYAIDEAFRNLYVVDLQLQEVVNTVKLPYRPAAITISEDGASLFIANEDLSELVTEVRLQDLTVVRHLSYPSSMGYADISDRHIYEQSGLLYVITGDWAPKLLMFNSVTFAPVNYGTAITGVGDLVFSIDKSQLFYWYQYGWGAGYAGSNVLKYSVSGNSLTKLGETSLSYQDLDRDPVDTPILLLEAQGKLIVKNKVFDPNDLSQVIGTLPEPVYAVNAAGTLLVGRKGIYDAATYQKVETLSLGAATEIYFSPDGQLYYFLNGVLNSVQK